MPPKAILGISAFYHDSAAALLIDGDVVAAAQEERFTRIKHDHEFPRNAAKFCLEKAGLAPDDLDAVVFYDKPLLKFERLLETYLTVAPAGLASWLEAMPLWLKQKLRMPTIIRDELEYSGGVFFTEHHESHAASAFFPSPFQEAAVLTLDGVGEWATTSWGVGRGTELELRHEMRFPHSLGMLYSAFTYFTGFKVNSGEYKIMGLAPYGEPKYVDVILNELVDLKEDGSFKLNMDYFTYCETMAMTGDKFAGLFGGPRRKPESTLTQREMDLARSVQEVTEEVVRRLARHVRKETGLANLTLAGGVALNCVANGVLLREGIFDRLWIQPAAGDAGGALGAALAYYYAHDDAVRDRPSVDGDNVANGNGLLSSTGDAMHGSYLGPDYDEEATRAMLDKYGAVYERLDEAALIERAADTLAGENVVGWCEGAMEFGPRALGRRSIMGDPRSAKTQSVMNLKIKYRESFRPFAPSVLRECVGEYFEIEEDSPYMLLVAPVREDRRRAMSDDEQKLWGIEKLNVPRSDIPSVTHVDYSARIQTVHADTNPRYHALIDKFREKTGYGVIVNTSFNVRGEPIILSPDDAYRCFMRTEMDALVCWPFFLEKSKQPEWHETDDWRDEFQLD